MAAAAVFQHKAAYIDCGGFVDDAIPYGNYSIDLLFAIYYPDGNILLREKGVK
jgi:hypothetical protein